MSKIQFYKKLKIKLSDDFDFDSEDETIDKIVKDYVNNLTVLPSIDDALDYIYNNYKSPVQPKQPTTTNSFNNSNPWDGLGIPGFGPNVSLQEKIKTMIDNKNKKKS